MRLASVVKSLSLDAMQKPSICPRCNRSIASMASFMSVAFGSLMSGAVYNAWGWEMLNWIVFPVTMLCLVSLAGLVISGRRKMAIGRS